MPEYWDRLQSVSRGMQPAPAGTREEMFEGILSALRGAGDIAGAAGREVGAITELAGTSRRPRRPPMALRNISPDVGGPGYPSPLTPTEEAAVFGEMAGAVAGPVIGGLAGKVAPYAKRLSAALGEPFGTAAAPTHRAAARGVYEQTKAAMQAPGPPVREAPTTPSAKALEAYETRKAELTPEPEPMAPVAEAPTDPRVLRSMRPELGAAAPPQTPAFKRWFGESKVVDEKGEPMVVYHGTTVHFDEFDTSQSFGAHFGSAEAARDRLEGIYALGPHFAPGRVADPAPQTMAVYIKLENPYRLPDMGNWDGLGILDELEADPSLDWSKWPGGKRGLADDMESFELEEDNYGKLQEFLKRNGYDGVVYKNIAEGTGDSYVVFDPTQAKSATGNVGTYNPTDPSILRSARPREGWAVWDGERFVTTPAAKDLEAGRKEALAYIDHPGFERRMVSRLKEMGMSKDEATVAFDRARRRVELTQASVVDPKELPGAAVATYTPADWSLDSALEGAETLGPAKIRVSRESTKPAYDSFHEFMHAAQDDELLIDFMNEADAFDLVTTPMGQRPYFATDPAMGVARAFGELLVDAVGAIPKQRKRVGSIHQISTEQADKIASSVLEEIERIPGAPKLTDFEKTLHELRTRPELQYIGSPNEAHVAMIQMRRDMLSEGFIKHQYEVIDERKMGEYLSRSYESLPSEVKTLRPYLTSKNLTTFTRAFNKVPAVVAAWSATKQSKEKPKQR